MTSIKTQLSNNLLIQQLAKWGHLEEIGLSLVKILSLQRFTKNFQALHSDLILAMKLSNYLPAMSTIPILSISWDIHYLMDSMILKWVRLQIGMI